MHINKTAREVREEVKETKQNQTKPRLCGEEEEEGALPPTGAREQRPPAAARPGIFKYS